MTKTCSGIQNAMTIFDTLTQKQKKAINDIIKPDFVPESESFYKELPEPYRTMCLDELSKRTK